MKIPGNINDVRQWLSPSSKNIVGEQNFNTLLTQTFLERTSKQTSTRIALTTSIEKQEGCSLYLGRIKNKRDIKKEIKRIINKK